MFPFDFAHGLHPSFPYTEMDDNDNSHEALVVLMNALLQDNAIDPSLDNHIAGEGAVLSMPGSSLASAGTESESLFSTTPTPNSTETRGIFDFIPNPFGEYMFTY